VKYRIDTQDGLSFSGAIKVPSHALDVAYGEAMRRNMAIADVASIKPHNAIEQMKTTKPKHAGTWHIGRSSGLRMPSRPNWIQRARVWLALGWSWEDAK
jgi:hypothetical protein